jgi:hypothetical protein
MENPKSDSDELKRKEAQKTELKIELALGNLKLNLREFKQGLCDRKEFIERFNGTIKELHDLKYDITQINFPTDLRSIVYKETDLANKAENKDSQEEQ